MTELKCVRCGHVWNTYREPEKIKRCAKCKTTNFNRKAWAHIDSRPVPVDGRTLRDTLPELTALEPGQSLIIPWRSEDFDTKINRRVLAYGRKRGRVYHTEGGTHGLFVRRVT